MFIGRPNHGPAYSTGELLNTPLVYIIWHYGALQITSLPALSYYPWLGSGFGLVTMWVCPAASLWVNGSIHQNGPIYIK